MYVGCVIGFPECEEHAENSHYCFSSGDDITFYCLFISAFSYFETLFFTPFPANQHIRKKLAFYAVP